MTNINKSFDKIVNPTIDFLFTDDLLSNKKYIKAVYDKIFTEIVRFVEKRPKLTIQACSLRKKPKTSDYIGKIRCNTKKDQYVISISFHKDIVSVSVNGEYLGESVIFGASINKETMIPSKIKVDIASLKKNIANIIK